jgi:hypothetical protein
MPITPNEFSNPIGIIEPVANLYNIFTSIIFPGLLDPIPHSITLQKKPYINKQTENSYQYPRQIPGHSTPTGKPGISDKQRTNSSMSRSSIKTGLRSIPRAIKWCKITGAFNRGSLTIKHT